MILVTGGAGFIGSNFVLRWLATRDEPVVTLDRLSYAGNLRNLATVLEDERHEFVRGDIGDAALVADLFERHRPRAVLNFAAESHVDRSIHVPEEFIQSNVVGTFRLLEAARTHLAGVPDRERGDFRFLHVSTDEVYGSLSPDDPAFREDDPYRPNSPYSASKAASDHLVRAYHETFDLPVLTSNCSNNYGPYQFPEKLIPLMIRNALAGEALPIYGDGMNVRDWLYVDDHCDALCRVLENGTPGETYNIGGRCELTNIEVVTELCRVLDVLRPGSPVVPHDSLVTMVKDRPGHDRRYAIDAGKIEAELGWAPRVSFPEGIERTVRWYLEHQDWVEEVAAGLHQGWSPDT